MRSDDARGHRQDAGAKLRIELTPAATRRSATSWAAPAGVAMMPMAIPCWRAIVGQVVDVADRDAADLRPTLPGSASTRAATGKPRSWKPRVVGEGLAQVADADDDDRPVVGEAELAAHLEQQVLDVVADAPGAVGAEVGEVLAHLGGVDAGQLGQPLGRDRGRPVVGHLEQAAQVDGQPGDRGLGDLRACRLPPFAIRPAAYRRLFTRSQGHDWPCVPRRRARARSAERRRRTLPARPWGSSSTNITFAGHL